MIDLPTTHGAQASDLRLIGLGGVMEGPLGGASQIYDRPGARHAISVSLPPMNAADARHWFSKLSRAVREGGRFYYRQVGLQIPSYGAIVVNGAGQTGNIIAFRNCTPNALFRDGQVLNIIQTAPFRRLLYVVDGNQNALPNGTGNLRLTTPLRISPNDGEAIPLDIVSIEGSVSPDNAHLPLSEARIAAGMMIDIDELV
jgi:hypothetical protein